MNIVGRRVGNSVLRSSLGLPLTFPYVSDAEGNRNERADGKEEFRPSVLYQVAGRVTQVQRDSVRIRSGASGQKAFCRKQDSARSRRLVVFG